MNGVVNHYAAGMYAAFEQELEEAMGAADVAARLRSSLEVVQRYLKLLRVKVEETGFGSEEEEVYFFRWEKPRFYCRMIYACERYGVDTGMPPAGGKQRRKYLAEQLRFIARFFRQHEFYYQYYRLGMTDMDRVWFLRGEPAERLWTLELPGTDRVFGTGMDYLFAKFMAYGLLEKYVLEQMSEPAGEDREPVLRSKKGRGLEWTGDTCNLVELVYGVYETRQVNKGEVDLSDLMDVFEQVFRVNLSRYFRRFTEIKRRKTISKTKFLDQMRDAVSKRIDDGDALAAKGPVKGSLRESDPFLAGNKYL